MGRLSKMLRYHRSAARNTNYRRLADFFVLFLEDFFGEDFFVLLLLAAAFFFVAICITPFQFWKRQKSRHRYYRLYEPSIIK